MSKPCFGWRDYDPMTRRFECPHRGSIPFRFQKFGYCLDDPVNMVDPVGLEGMSWGGDGRRLSDGPKLGNFCGKNWTGGQNPKNHNGQSGLKPPVSSMDEHCESHDYCYRNSFTSDERKLGDDALLKMLEQLPDDPRNWVKPPPEGTEVDNDLMKEGAIQWFK